MSDENTPSKPTQRVIHADCLDALRAMDADSVDAIVTDPPAGIAFMNKDWDRDKGGRTEWVAWMTEIARECLRVIKPGGHALVWAIPRTSHWTGWAWEDAGWTPRDKVVHLFGSGFPKSLDVSKAIDKAAGAEREVRPVDPARAGRLVNQTGDYSTDAGWSAGSRKITTDPPATEAARTWQGWGTALKPAAEDWWLFRKPLAGTIAANVLAHGTGAINIDGCRIGFTSAKPQGAATAKSGALAGGTQNDRERKGFVAQQSALGRWPANVVLGCACDGDTHDENCAAAMLDAQTGELPSQQTRNPTQKQSNAHGMFNLSLAGRHLRCQDYLGESGGASRFFYTAKASRRERGEGNTHPTVKPVALMRWLVKLVCPPGGTILDPFCGSGTTLLAARAEGFDAVGIEREAEYVEIIRQRLEEATPEWLREIELEGQEDESTSKTEPEPTSLDDLLGFNDE